MKHKRSRPDYEMRGFKYWAKPEGQLPQDFSDHVERLRLAWNALVQLFWQRYDERNAKLRKDKDVRALESRLAEAEATATAATKSFAEAKMQSGAARHFKSNDVDDAAFVLKTWQQVKTEAFATTGKLRRELSAARRTAARRLKLKGDSIGTLAKLASKEVARFGIRLTDHRDGEALFQSFINTRGMFLSGKGGPPRFKSKNDSMSLCSRYADGGRPVGKLHSKSTWFFMDTVIDPKGRARFWWGLNGNLYEFRTILHRPLPENGYIKSVRLRRDDGNKWWLVFGVEEPPVEKLAHGKHVVAVYPRWTKFEKTGLHVCDVYVDDEAPGSVPMRFPQVCLDLYERVNWMDQLQSEADGFLESAKAEAARYGDDLKALDGWGNSLALCRHSGMMRLVFLLKEQMPGHALLKNDTFRRGLRMYGNRMREKNGVHRRITRYRDAMYWKLGQEIAQMAKVVIWREVDLKSLGRRKDVEEITDELASRIRRQKSLAAPGELLDKLKKQCFKRGVEVVIETLEKETRENEGTKADEKRGARVAKGTVRKVPARPATPEKDVPRPVP